MRASKIEVAVCSCCSIPGGPYPVPYVLILWRRDLYASIVEERTCENVLESKLDVAGVQGRRLDEGQVVLA